MKNHMKINADCLLDQGRTGHRKSDQPGHNLTQPSPAQWPSKTHWAGLGQDDFVSANELAILTCQGPAR